MKNRKDRELKRADKFINDINAGRMSEKPSAAHEVKPEVVKDIPNDMGRHGSDDEIELNPEE